MRFYNTLTRRVEDFKPDSDTVKLYSCGPTVYDYAHLGNLRAYVFTDTLRRALESADYQVRNVMNITDVGHLSSDADEGEDKLEKGAQKSGKSVWEVAELYTEAFKSDIKRLNILPPNAYRDEKHSDNYARATSFIDEQLQIVKLLIDKGFAYKSEQAIYFDVTRLPSYGELTGQKLHDKEVAARGEVVTDPSKRNPQDFALWFFTVGRFADHSMRWLSPWGEGFPGWHLECSAIIHATLGEPLDIHTGGVDHIGTHHTNEIAQSEAAFGKKLANFWLHNEHMLVDGQKMSKSLGNFYTLSEVIKKGYDPLALRLLFLQSHYRTQTNFTWQGLDSAQSFLQSLRAMADLRFQSAHKGDLLVPTELEAYKAKIKRSLFDDLNTPKALAILRNLADELPFSNLRENSAHINALLTLIDQSFGLNLLAREDIDDDSKNLIKQREEARQNQNWQLADRLRDELQKQEVEINDTPYGPIWSRTK